jgi:hypothetical protein
MSGWPDRKSEPLPQLGVGGIYGQARCPYLADFVAKVVLHW